MSFDLNKHFDNYSSRPFFNELTYADLGHDIAAFSKSIGEEKNVALKIKSPYLTFVALMGLFVSNKIAILLSPLETAKSESLLRAQVSFHTVIEDSFFLTPLKTSHPPFIYPLLNQDQIALVVFSSGSTSTPKGIALSFNNLYFSALGFIEFFKQNELETSLINLPHHHVGGLMTLFRAFFSGGKLTTNPDDSFDFISLVPLQLKKILNDPLKLPPLKKTRVILIGGAPVSESLKQEAQTQNLSLFETYGMSESTSLVTINGQVLPYRKVSLDPNGYFLIDGEVKCLGYFQNQSFYPEKKGWLKTNDIGEQSSEGTFHFIKRADLIFISGGENINPLSIEERLAEFPGIKQLALIGLPDEKWGQQGLLLYETCGASTPHFLNEFKTYASACLHPYQVPKSFFEYKMSSEGIKPKRSELRKVAHSLLLKSLFSFDYVENKNAPLIVFLHGFLGDKDDLKKISEGLDERFSLLFIDLPGHGQTKIEHFYSTQDIFQKLSDFILLFHESPILYGYSMGGRIALQLALHFLKVNTLILESTGLGLENREEQMKRQKEDLLLFKKGQNTEDFLHQWYKNSLFSIFRDHPSYLENIERKKDHPLSEWQDSQVFLSQGRFPLKEENRQQLNMNPIPLLLYLYGEHDQKYASNASVFKNSHMIKGAGHNPNKTHVAEIREILNLSLK